MLTIADAIRRQLGNVVNKPGLKQAELRINAGQKQVAAAAQAGTTENTIRKYRPLVDKVIGASAAGAALAVAAALIGPLAAGVAGGVMAAVARSVCRCKGM